MKQIQTPQLIGVEKKYSKTVLDDNEVRLLNIIGTGSSPRDRIINDREKLKWVLGVFKREGLKIVYTSGVYDSLHDGHVLYLEKAKSRGDILVVGVDSDEYTRLRKPDEPNRPIDTLSVRLTVLARNRPVNILTVRDINEHPDQLIVDILPDVAVFSRSTKDENFEEKINMALRDYCGEIVFLDPQSTGSTTAKIRKFKINGAHELAVFLKEKLDGKIPSNLLEKHIDEFLNPKHGGKS